MENMPGLVSVFHAVSYTHLDVYKRQLFFLRDYSYPLSRGYFRRYTDEVTPREQCTLLMISAPNTPKGQSCFESTGVDTIVVNPRYDAVQFNKAKDMSLLYVSDSIAVYKKTE